MKKASIFLALALVAPVPAQCGPNGCAVPSTYSWQPGVGDDAHRTYLYCDGAQIGGYDLVEHVYRPFDGRTWGPAATAPIQPPCYGVDRAKISPVQKYTVNGVEVDRKRAYEAVEKGLVDDSNKLRITVIGAKEAREPVLKSLEAFKQDCVVQGFDANAWQTEPGFVKTGSPTIYCQAPTGKVLHRQDDSTGVVEAVRKAKESYDPKKDPDLRKTNVPGGPLNIPLVPILLVAVLGWMVWRVQHEGGIHAAV